MDASRVIRQLTQPRVGRPAATPEKGSGSKTDAKQEDLPSGWVKVPSKSKPGAFFYAHPATKRTQLEKPGSERKVGPQRPSRHHRDQLKAERASSSRRDAGKAEPVEVLDAPVEELVVDLEAEAEQKQAAIQAAEQKQKARAEAAAQKQKARAEAEAEDAAREEALVKARERRAQAAQAQREDPPDEPAEDLGQCVEPPVSTSASSVAKTTVSKPRRVGVSAGAASEGQAKKRRKAWQKDVNEGGDEDVTQEDLERFAESSTEHASDEDSSEAQKEAVGPQREVLPEPEQIFEPCLDVLKSGLWVERHPLVGKQQFVLGRAAGQVDVPMQHESISRQHATIIRKDQDLFVADTGSAHGTMLDGQKLLTNTLAKLEHGAQLSFGASSRLYVFYTP